MRYDVVSTYRPIAQTSVTDMYLEDDGRDLMPDELGWKVWKELAVEGRGRCGRGSLGLAVVGRGCWGLGCLGLAVKGGGCWGLDSLGLVATWRLEAVRHLDSCTSIPS
jgi:hypothetical protein